MMLLEKILFGAREQSLALNVAEVLREKELAMVTAMDVRLNL